MGLLRRAWRFILCACDIHAWSEPSILQTVENDSDAYQTEYLQYGLSVCTRGKCKAKLHIYRRIEKSSAGTILTISKWKRDYELMWRIRDQEDRHARQ
jgi:hypothetical protein